MLANYLTTFFRYGRFHIALMFVQMFVVTASMTSLLLFSAGFIHNIPFDQLSLYLLFAMIMILMAGILLDRRRLLTGDRELSIRRIFGAELSDLYVQLAIESFILNISGAILSYVLLDLLFILLRIEKSAFDGYYLTDVHSICTMLILQLPVSLSVALVPFISLAKRIRRGEHN